MKISFLPCTLSLTFLLLVGCTKTNNCQGESTVGFCACYRVYQPVCGCNGETYSNDCNAECDGVMDYTPGACPG